MARYVARRVLYSVVVLATSSFVVFMIVSAIRGSSIGLYGNPAVAYETIPEIAARRHLNDSLVVQYLHWVREAFTEQFGTTIADNRPILPDLGRALSNTLQLVIVSEVIAVLLAIIIGVVSALRQYSVIDHVSTTFSFLGVSMPVFWLALMLQVLVVQIYGWTGARIFPVANLNSVDPGTGVHFWLDRAHHLVLPVVVLVFTSVAVYSRYVRTAMLEAINSDHVRAARARGLTSRKVTIKHMLRNSLGPLVTVVALNFGTLFGGVIVIETVFSLDGMGLYFINALGSGDAYRVMAWLMITATVVVTFNLVADLLYGVLDPRVRLDN